jgi:hypothetical protein
MSLELQVARCVTRVRVGVHQILADPFRDGDHRVRRGLHPLLQRVEERIELERYFGY